MINNGVSVTLTLHVPTNATTGTAGGLYVLSGENVRPWAVGILVESGESAANQRIERGAPRRARRAEQAGATGRYGAAACRSAV